MDLPRHYLQGGAKYANLTTIRVSGDRFQRERWKEFLYGSRMASALGVWPWTDVFKSRETPNILLATLSAGMVGIGDRIGDEDLSNVLRSVRPDGTIVKPDVPLVPLDWTYVSDAEKKGLRVASTYTDHGKGLRTLYIFAYADSLTRADCTVPAADLGVRKKMFAYDYFVGTGRIIQSDEGVELDFKHDSCSYTIFSPIASNGIAFLGDPQKFVSNGKQRIERIAVSKGILHATILVAKGDRTITILAYSPRAPIFSLVGTVSVESNYDDASHIFRLTVRPENGLKYQVVGADSVGRIRVGLSMHSVKRR